MKPMRRDSGFTLMELLVSLAIMSITFAAAIFYSTFARQGPGFAAERLRGDLQTARIMAIRRNQTCSILLNQPGPDQYCNSLERRTVCFSSYHGGVRFLPLGPDGARAGSVVSFNSLGMSASAVPVDLFVADRQGAAVYRIRVLSPGGISLSRWDGAGWS